MKKILTVLMMTLIMAGLFAYEPKVECFTVFTFTGSAYYEEEVVVEDNILFQECLLDDDRHFKRSSFFNLNDLKYEAERSYFELLESRNRVEQLTKEKEMNKRYKKDYMVDYLGERIECEINEAIYEIPFVTRENFYKISKSKYMKMFIRYMENLKKENK